MKFIKKITVSLIAALVFTASLSAAVYAENGEIIEIIDEDSAAALFTEAGDSEPAIAVDEGVEPVVIEDEASPLTEAPETGATDFTALIAGVLLTAACSAVIAGRKIKA